MGRVPVILADTWLPPVGPWWERFAIQVPEKDFAQLPRILEEREDQAVEMGELARTEWDRWFSEEVLFHHLVELCLDIQRHRTTPESLARWSAYVHYLRPFHFRRMLGTLVRSFWRTRRNEATDPQRCPQ